MFTYYLKLAVVSLKRTPILSMLMVLAIALGIGASMTTITVNKLMQAYPLPGKEERLLGLEFRIDATSGDAEKDAQARWRSETTWKEASVIGGGHEAPYQTAIQYVRELVKPENRNIKKYHADGALVHNDFFNMFEASFLYGGPWSQQDEDSHAQVIVIDKQENDKLFQGENSVGRTISYGGFNFKVVGVLDRFPFSTKFYSFSLQTPTEFDRFYIPFPLKEPLLIKSAAGAPCFEDVPSREVAVILAAECIESAIWVELDDADDKSRYMDFLRRYVEEQNKLGRLTLMADVVRLQTVFDYMEEQGYRPQSTQVMVWLSILFLAVCLLNMTAILISKITFNYNDIALRRALGASRRDIFMQYVTESLIIGMVGGLVGLLLTVWGVLIMRGTYGELLTNVLRVDYALVGFAIVLSLFVSLLAAVLPIWRACRISPAIELKTQ